MRIEIPGNPIPKARHRSSIFGGGIHNYDPQDKEKKCVTGIMGSIIQSMFDSDDKSLVMMASDQFYSESCCVDMTFYMIRAKSFTKTVQNRIAWGLQPHVEKPDTDNLVKFYMDCANGVLFHDDRQVVEIHARKCYSRNPRTVIEIMGKKKLEDTDATVGILQTLSPVEFFEYLEVVHELGLLGMDIDEEGFWRTVDHHSQKSQQWRTKAALLLSEFAEKFTPHLLKIRKNWPDFYEKNKKVVEFKQVLEGKRDATEEG